MDVFLMQLLYPAPKRNKPAIFPFSPETDEWEMDRYLSSSYTLYSITL